MNDYYLLSSLVYTGWVKSQWHVCKRFKNKFIGVRIVRFGLIYFQFVSRFCRGNIKTRSKLHI